MKRYTINRCRKKRSVDKKMAKKIVSIEIKDYSKAVLNAMKEQVELGLEAIGAEAVTYAQKDCPVDTGALRNSLAWATKDKTAGNPQSGEGSPSNPKGTPAENSVYIGSNLKYAAAQEYGDYNHKVGKKHFIRDAMTNHSDHYKEIMEAALK